MTKDEIQLERSKLFERDNVLKRKWRVIDLKERKPISKSKKR